MATKDTTQEAPKTEAPATEAEEESKTATERQPRPKLLKPGKKFTGEGRVAGGMGSGVTHVVAKGSSETLCGLTDVPARWLKGEKVAEDGLVTCPLCAAMLDSKGKVKAAS